MNITVLGLWHLGSVTAACASKHFKVTGLDFDETVVGNLLNGKAPLFEPGLDDLIADQIEARRLTFTCNAILACVDADVLWVAYDTPVNEADESDSAFVLDRLNAVLPNLAPGTLVLISSQLPVGTTAILQDRYPQFRFAYSPENLRLGRAIEAFEKAERVVVGIPDDSKKDTLERVFDPFTDRIVFMRTESAEMVKHALNSFLAASITFINEIARVCEHVGADSSEVTAGLKSEPRIGPRAYLGAGGPFAGGTLARDVVTLTQLGEKLGIPLTLIPAIKQSNDEHRAWICQRLQKRFGDLRGRTFAILGLTYTPQTDTLRRSAAVDLCHDLLAAGAEVRAHDPAVTELPDDLSAVHLGTLANALEGADAVIVCTEWPEFREALWSRLLPLLRQPVVVDANCFLESQLRDCTGVELYCVGRAS